MKKHILLSILVLFAALTHAETSVLFHPNGPTLEAIAAEFAKAEKSIDIAMYNMDTGASGPIIQWLNSDEIKKRMAEKTLFVRVLLNGNPKDQKKAGKMTSLESSGADVRWLPSSRELHHKFAVIDTGLAHPQVISGSANWSEGSRTSYTENIFYVKDEAGLSQLYQNQFNFLWSIASEFGNTGANQNITQGPAQPSDAVTAFFNVPDSAWLKRSGNVTAADYLLTREFITAIDSSKVNLKIATTRFRLAPIYDAVKRAAARGVKVQLILTQAEYQPYYRRANFNLPICTDLYSRRCSLNTNYAIPLLDQAGVEIRVKHFSLRGTDGIQQQMHSKYLIVDDSQALSGSFNLSIASEFSNFENVARFSAPGQIAAIQAFTKNFSELWELNRANYTAYTQNLEAKLKAGEEFGCQFPAMILSYYEMDAVLKLGEAYKVRLDKACK